MQEQVNKIEEQVEAIHTALVGDPTYKRPGIIDEVRKNTKHRKQSVKRAGFITGTSVSVGAGLKALWEWLTHV